MDLKLNKIVIFLCGFVISSVLQEGGFYSAEDADSLATEDASEKREGAFYVWTYDEIESVLSQPLESNENIRLSEVFSHHYNIRKNGNVDPQNVSEFDE